MSGPKFPAHRTRTTGAHLRLAAAIVISVLVHSWLAAGLKLEAARPGAAPHYGAIHVRLEPALPPDSFNPPRRTAPTEPTVAAHEAPNRIADVKSAQGRIGVPQSPAAVLSPAPPAEQENTAATAPGLTVPPTPDPVYYPARQLDVYPALLESSGLVFPERAAREGVVGNVTVLLLIDHNGIVNEISVVEAEPAGYFEDAARSAFDAMRFIPARKNGRAVRSRILISVSFGSEQPQSNLRQRPR
jgi:protein TonB